MVTETVCAVVVTYNRKELLLECLEALRKQTRPLDGIYLIDNASTDKTPELLLEKGYIKELPPDSLFEPWEKTFYIKLPNEKDIPLHYVRMHENTGGAGGFHEGVKRGYEKGYDWLWLMDDDAEPKENALEILFSDDYFNNKEKIEISALVCNILNNECKFAYSDRGFFNKLSIIKPLKEKDLKNRDSILIDIGTFVGFLLNSKVILKAGMPYSEFFIWYDDTEYSLRIRKYGRIVFNKKSIIRHKYNQTTEYLEIKKFFKFRFFTWKIENYWKALCGYRNKAYIYRKYGNMIGLAFFKIKIIFQILIFEDHKLLRMKYLLKYYKQKDIKDFKTIKPDEWKNILKQKGIIK